MEAEKTPLSQVKCLEEAHGTAPLLCYEDLKRPNTHCYREVLVDLLRARSGKEE